MEENEVSEMPLSPVPETTDSCHEEEHSSVQTEERVFKCPTCATCFSQKSRLKMHVQVHLGRGKTHKCPLCAACFKNKSHFDRHSRIHSGENPFKCTECDKSFTERGRLTHHLETHRKDYTCAVCEKQFSRLWNLKEHYETQHTTNRPFKCSVCSKSFAIRPLLNSHFRTHTGQKAYECSACEKRFSQRPALMSHMRNRHAEREYKCLLCSAAYLEWDRLEKHVGKHAIPASLRVEVRAQRRENSQVNTDEKAKLKWRALLEVLGPNRGRAKAPVPGPRIQSSGLRTHQEAESRTGARLNPPLFKCTVCTASFDSEDPFKAHVKTHISSVLKTMVHR